MRTLLTLTLLLAAGTAQAENCGNPDYRYPRDPQIIQDYRYQEGNFLEWQRRYNAAPSGSWEESTARESMQRTRAYISSLLRDTYRYVGFQSAELRNLAQEADQKYNAASSGSMGEALYNEVRGYFWNSFAEKSGYDLECTGFRWEQLVQEGERFASEYNAAPSGSLRERIFAGLRDRALQQADVQVRYELEYYPDYRQVEDVAMQLVNKYNAAPSGSRLEAFYRSARDTAFLTAERKFTQAVYGFATDQLYYLQEDYNRRYNGAPSGSSQERYFARIRDIARAEWSRRGGR